MTAAIMALTDRATNAELMVDCRDLGYIGGAVADLTYGAGTFWKRWRPERLHTSDLDLVKSPCGMSVDFTDTGFIDAVFSTVVLDPPYKLCLDGKTEILTRRGWLTYDQLTTNDHAYSIDPDTAVGRWNRVTAVNVFDKGPTLVAVCEGKNLDFVATPDHTWLVNTDGGGLHWKRTRQIRSHDSIPHSAAWEGQPDGSCYQDALVELVAWYWTEGTRDRPSFYGHITQSHAVNAPYCERIASCFRRLYGPPTAVFDDTGRTSTAAWRWRDEDRIRRFIFSATIGRTLEQHAPDKQPTIEFLEALTPRQLDLFITTSLEADGQDDWVLAQSELGRSAAFALACVLAGRPIATRQDANGHVVSLKRRSFSKPFRPGIKWEVRDTVVWCPTVDRDHTWLARRNGRIYFTGNSGTPALGEMDERYGVHGAYTSRDDRHQLMKRGITEAARLLKVGGHLLFKCQDQVVGGKVRWQTRIMADHGETVGLNLVDSLLFPSYRPQPPGRRQVHARRNYSTLLVFRKATT